MAIQNGGKSDWSRSVIWWLVCQHIFVGLNEQTIRTLQKKLCVLRKRFSKKKVTEWTRIWLYHSLPVAKLQPKGWKPTFSSLKKQFRTQQSLKYSYWQSIGKWKYSFLKSVHMNTIGYRLWKIHLIDWMTQEGFEPHLSFKKNTKQWQIQKI